jgi:hypothetical protein
MVKRAGCRHWIAGAPIIVFPRRVRINDTVFPFRQGAGFGLDSIPFHLAMSFGRFH